MQQLTDHRYCNMPERISRNAALRQGLTRYFTGNVCQKCGEICERHASNDKCVVCFRKKIKDRRKAAKAVYTAIRNGGN